MYPTQFFIYTCLLFNRTISSSESGGETSLCEPQAVSIQRFGPPPGDLGPAQTQLPSPLPGGASLAQLLLP